MKSKAALVVVVLCLAVKTIINDDWPDSLAPLEWSRAKWSGGFLLLFDLLIVIYYFRRAIVLGGDSVQIHNGFYLRQERLPAHVTISRNRRGGVVLTNAKTGHSIVTIGRDCGDAEEMESALKTWLRINGRLDRPWHEALGVSPTASIDEVRIAYEGMIAKYDPRKVAQMEPEFQRMAADMTTQVNAAYQEACLFLHQAPQRSP